MTRVMSPCATVPSEMPGDETYEDARTRFPLAAILDPIRRIDHVLTDRIIEHRGTQRGTHHGAQCGDCSGAGLLAARTGTATAVPPRSARRARGGLHARPDPRRRQLRAGGGR